MAQKKVSGKGNSEKPTKLGQDIIYDDFIAKYGQEMRKRATKTVAEPKKQQTDNQNASRCGEIEPHTTHNPATQHQIINKRTSKILTDDTGFKADSYNDRFALTPEMPEMRDEDKVTESEIEQTGIPGQQTMAELFLNSDEKEDISVPIEGQIEAEDDNPFLATYNRLKSGGEEFGKSEKLRAIARTATDDAEMQPDSQLTFPSFDPLFKFPEDETKSKKSKKLKRSQKAKKAENKDSRQVQSFDIDENEIVTSHSSGEQVQTEQIQPEKNNKKELFDFLNDSDFNTDIEPPFEIGGKDELKNALKKLAVSSKTALIQSGVLLVLGLILFIISAVFDAKEDSLLRKAPVLYSIINLIFLFIAAGTCLKELSEGIKNILKKKLSINTGGVFILLCAIIQCISSFFTAKTFPGNVHLISSVAIFSMIAVVLPKFFMSNNTRLTVSMFTPGNSVSILKTARNSGIDGVLQAKYGNEGNVRYTEKAEFATGLMHSLTNAMPKLFGSNAAYAFVLCFSVIVALAAGLIQKSFSIGITAFCAMVIACLPISYTLSAAFALYSTNSAVAKNKSSLISYRLTQNLTKTDAIIFDAAEIIEQPSSSIHGIKNFGRIDPQKATLYCAAAVNAASSPLENILKQVTDQGNDEVPQAEDVSITAFSGIAATVEGKKVLFGSRKFLEDNGVSLPEEDLNEKYVTGDRKLLYLAIDGSFCILFIVSYHIKRSVSALIKYLISKKIKPVIYSCDPNVTAEFIAKKCKIRTSDIFELDESESAYMKATSLKTETALPADVFTNGKLSSLSSLIRYGFALNSFIETLPFMIYAFIAINAIAIAAPFLLGNVFAVSNIYILLIRIVGFAIGIAAFVIKSKQRSM